MKAPECPDCPEGHRDRMVLQQVVVDEEEMTRRETWVCKNAHDYPVIYHRELSAGRRRITSREV